MESNEFALKKQAVVNLVREERRGPGKRSERALLGAVRVHTLTLKGSCGVTKLVKVTIFMDGATDRA